MEQAIAEYRAITSTDEFKELERQRHYAAHNKASALGHARREGYREASEKWESVVAGKDAELAGKDVKYAAELAGKDAKYAAELAGKDAELAEQARIIAELKAQLG